jgi:hypothetical protein
MKKKIALILIFASSCAYAMSEAEFDIAMAKHAEKMAKTLPRQIDSETELSGIGYTPSSKMFAFTYRLINDDASEWKGDPVFSELIRRIGYETFCNSKNERNYMRIGVSYKLRYTGRDFRFIEEFAVNDSGCKTRGM